MKKTTLNKQSIVFLYFFVPFMCFGMISSDEVDWTTFTGRVAPQNEGRELFKDFKQIGGGGEACVYDVGNDTLLRVMQAHRFVVPQQYFHESNIINTFEQIRAQHMHFSVIKTLGYFIFSSEPSKLFYPNTIFKEKESLLTSDNDMPYYYQAQFMGRVITEESYDHHRVDFKLAYLFLKSLGFDNIEAKDRNQGYLMDASHHPSYNILGKKYKTVTEDGFTPYFFDCYNWKKSDDLNEEYLSQELEDLLQTGSIIRVDE